MRWRAEDEPVPTDTAFDDLNVDTLKPLAGLLTKEVPKRKGELVALLTGVMRKPAQVRALYEKLDPLGQRAVQEATHDAEGLLHRDRFAARYGELPSFHQPSPDPHDRYSSYYGYKHPTTL